MKYIDNIDDLKAMFGAASESSLAKEASMLHPIYRSWIEQSPFAVLATIGPDGLDTSPRGDPAPLVRILDERTLLLPERRGNNRIDSLRNILHDENVSVIFFVPGVGETVRVNGTARINVDPGLLTDFAIQGQLPKCIVEVSVHAVYFQCAKSLIRSSLWTTEQIDRRPSVPSAGQMLAALTNDAIEAVAYDEALPVRQASSLY